MVLELSRWFMTEEDVEPELSALEGAATVEKCGRETPKVYAFSGICRVPEGTSVKLKADS